MEKCKLRSRNAVKSAQAKFSYLTKTDENFKLKFSNAMKQFDHHGERCPSYGMKWITDDTNDKKIKKSSTVPVGWRLVRKYHKSFVPRNKKLR